MKLTIEYDDGKVKRYELVGPALIVANAMDGDNFEPIRLFPQNPAIAAEYMAIADLHRRQNVSDRRQYQNPPVPPDDDPNPPDPPAPPDPDVPKPPVPPSDPQ